MYLDGAATLPDAGGGHGTVEEALPLGEARAVVHDAFGPAELPAAPAPCPGPAAWDVDAVYVLGDRVSCGGAVFEAAWRSRGHKPGASAHCPWQEIATAPDGTAVWTRSRIFDAGDVAVHDGASYVAQWWTRGQEPGDTRGPWHALPGRRTA